MISEIQKILISRGQTLAVAESCTGGLLSTTITQHAGVSAFFLGSVVSYSNDLKKNILHVSESLLRTVGAVSSPVALEMARGLKSLTAADWTVSITGIAGPAGGTKEKPVGTVYFGVCGPGIELAQGKLFPGNRQQIQEAAMKHSIELLTKSLKGEPWT
ncbi:CinA family protein [bacterium]|nr:CinA family protein [bacterium]